MSGGGGGDGGLGDSVGYDQEVNPTGPGHGSWKVPWRRCDIRHGWYRHGWTVLFQGFQILAGKQFKVNDHTVGAINSGQKI